jgi:hypothetical protein
MKIVFQIFSVLMLSLPVVALAYDWEEEEGGPGNGAEREIQLTRNRTYPGGADEQDLKVQKSLAPVARSPEAAAELVKREGADEDDHSANE